MRNHLAVRRPLFAATFLAAIAGLVVGCSSGGSPEVSSSSAPPATSTTATSAADTTGYPAGKEEICAARDQLKESVAALTKPAVLAGGSAAVDAALEKVKTDLGALKTAGATDYKTETDAVSTALDQVQEAVGNLGDGGGTGNLTAVTTAAGALTTAAADLFSKLTTACGS